MSDIRDQKGGSGYGELRREMVERQIRRRGVRDPLLIRAMEAVPRHEFVPVGALHGAYADTPLAIGEGQTISQPYMVAAMTEALELTASQRVLEIGAGSGYQAAILSLLAQEVMAIESRPLLARAARERLARLGYSKVSVEVADGSQGWPAAAAVRCDFGGRWRSCRSRAADRAARARRTTGDSDWHPRKSATALHSQN